MSYATVSNIRRDPWVRERVTACAAIEGVGDPDQWASDRAWALAAQPGWAEAWESALAAHPEDGYLPGQDEAVITDQHILAAVQSLREAT